MNETSQSTLIEVYNCQKEYFKNGHTLDVEDRIICLKKLLKLIKSNIPEINKALFEDLKKDSFETIGHEISGVTSEIKKSLKSVKKFSKGKRVSANLLTFPCKAMLKPRPKGNVLIIAPWNYPFLLTLRPIVSALAAGNTVIFKPSELSPSTSSLMVDLINKNFPKELIHGFLGGVETSNNLLDLEWHHIFFTGSTSVGKIIYEKAASKLTPVTLELGGKSPCILDKNIDIITAAKKIAWAKSINSGQTCVAPDYILVPEESKVKFYNAFSYWINKFYGPSPETNKQYTAIISQRHFERLKSLAESSSIIFGGSLNEAERKISPAIIEATDLDSPIMKEEIFGPLLPVITYKDNYEVFEAVDKNPNPLALYLFTDRSSWRNSILSKINAGASVVNDLVIHLAHHKLPFGGVRQSGIGRYHGDYGLETFSHMRSEIIKPSNKMLDNPIRYAPYNALKQRIVKIIFGL